MTASISKRVPRQSAIRIAVALGLAATALSQAAMAADVLVVTDSRHPVQAPAGARVIELDQAGRIEAELSAGLSADSARAAAIVQQRLRDGGQDLQRRIARAYQEVADAWGLGIAKLPAVVVGRRYVVYGDADVARAMARIETHRRAKP